MYALRWLLERYDVVIVLIGMASESHTWRNPFTAGERMEMIERVVKWLMVDEGRVRIAVMPTLEVYSGYSLYVLHMFPRIESVATANTSVAAAFSHAGISVVRPPLMLRDKYRGEYIRKLLASKNPEWRFLVPKPVAEYLVEIGAENRLEQIASSS